jgi:hypothetical protein
MNSKETSGPLLWRNQRLITYEPVEFEQQPVEVGDFRRITGHFREMYRIYLK